MEPVQQMAGGEGGVVQELSIPIYECKGWLKLIGVMSIISGGLSALSIVGILWAWLPIWMGVLLFQSASAVEEAYSSGRKDSMTRSLGKLKTYFIITGILTLLGLVGGALVIALMIAGVFAGLANM